VAVEVPPLQEMGVKLVFKPVSVQQPIDAVPEFAGKLTVVGLLA
jgi:hypothetical protein